MNSQKFKTLITDYHATHGRHNLPWRKTRDPYRILVSETMLQQTQVSRVLKKYKEFLDIFPTVQALAQASTTRLLSVWQGLGYNRRALNLKRTAEIITRDYAGTFPKDAHLLESLPGIGQSTRGAIMAFAFNIPTVFIETNIRAVFLHFFFKDTKETHIPKKVHDKELLPLIEKTLDTKNPRDWYYALMDYGVYLKLSFPNPSRQSIHHAKQSPFKGSNRELRSHILKYVLEKQTYKEKIVEHFMRCGKTEVDIHKNLANLEKEGFIKTKRNKLYIA